MEDPTDEDRHMAKHFSVTHVPTLFFAIGEQHSTGEGHHRMITVIYEGKPRLEPIRQFMTAQLDRLQKTGHGDDAAPRQLQQGVPRDDQQAKEL